MVLGMGENGKPPQVRISSELWCGKLKKLCLKTRSLWLTVLKSSSKEMLFRYFLFPFCQKLMQKQSSCEVQGRSTECGTAPKRGTDTQQASGFGALSF